MKITMVRLFAAILILITGCNQANINTEKSTPVEPKSIRLGVSLTPQELSTFQIAIKTIDDVHPEWKIILENTPQSGIVEKINAQLSANELPDIVRLTGLFSQQWIRKNAFLDLTTYIQNSTIDIGDFYAGPLSQFEYRGNIWGLPDTAAPDVVFYNKSMFDAAGLLYPTDDWSFEEMRRAAIQLTLDANGNNPSDPGFDPSTIQQWGWNGGITNIWQRHFVQPFGVDFCRNDDCTIMNFTDSTTLGAINWWASLVNVDYAAPYDPYGGSQTGVPGDPFIAGKAAIGYNGFFAVGQLNEVGHIDYDIVQPFIGVDGNRYTPLSTNGYLISANTNHADVAWQILQELLDTDFLVETWGKPGHSVPARRSAAHSTINLSHPPENQEAILAAMEYGEVFKPYTSSAFEVFSKTNDIFTQAMKGDIDTFEAMKEIEKIANETLKRDQ
jgi:multiple sugar transport system substrate-binding protein